jgi:hypothetical protein
LLHPRNLNYSIIHIGGKEDTKRWNDQCPQAFTNMDTFGFCIESQLSINGVGGQVDQFSIWR